MLRRLLDWNTRRRLQARLESAWNGGPLKFTWAGYWKAVCHDFKDRFLAERRKQRKQRHEAWALQRDVIRQRNELYDKTDAVRAALYTKAEKEVRDDVSHFLGVLQPATPLKKKKRRGRKRK